MLTRGCSSSSFDEISRSSRGIQEAKDLIRDEPKVLDAYINDVGVLYAAVLDDGTRRDGYAMYLCEVFGSKRHLVKRVKIVKYGSSKSPDRDNAYGILLGEHHCQ